MKFFELFKVINENKINIPIIIISVIIPFIIFISKRNIFYYFFQYIVSKLPNIKIEYLYYAFYFFYWILFYFLIKVLVIIVLLILAAKNK
jgi:hypothetical protein